jgi:hydroxyacylglutathione hydrolase
VLQAEIERVQGLRAQGQPSVPSTVERERRVNPFLRAHTPELEESAMAHAGQPLADAVGVFAELRRWKDGYKSTLK